MRLIFLYKIKNNFIKIEKYIFLNNIKIIDIILYKFLKISLTNLILPSKFNYSWLVVNNNFIKLYKNYNSNFVYTSFLQKNTLKINKKQTSVKNIIISKKKNGLIKNNFDINKSMVNHFFFNRKQHEFINSKTYFIKNENNKSYDLKKNIKIFLKKNKEYLSKILKKKYHNNKVFSKHIKYFLKRNNKILLLKTELSVKNLLIRSGFFLNFRDINFFFLEKNIFLNGKPCENINTFVRLGDVINIEFDEYNYLFFRQKLEYKNYILNKMTNIFFKIKKPNTKINKKIQNYTNINEDIPNFLEVDFLTMSIILIKYPSDFRNFNFLLSTFMNLYMKRSFLWKIIV